MNKKLTYGFLSPVVLILIFIIVAASGLYFTYTKVPSFQELLTGVDKTDPDWKMKYCSKELAILPGPPNYATNSFPLVFTRENHSLGTIEYLDVFPAIDFYVKLSVYEK